jgi:hypothetical protein
LTDNGSIIRRAPGGVPVEDVKIGDLAVVTKFPTVCIVPTNKSIEWTAISLSKDTISIDFLIYVSEGDTERATIDLLKLTDVVEWILMSNLHIKPEGQHQDYEVTSAAMVRNIDYGTIQKGSEFLKASKLTWTAELVYARDYLFNQAPYERKY